MASSIVHSECLECMASLVPVWTEDEGDCRCRVVVFRLRDGMGFAICLWDCMLCGVVLFGWYACRYGLRGGGAPLVLALGGGVERLRLNSVRYGCNVVF